MRHFLIPVLLLSLVAGCSSVKIGPHRIDVQQGNALDQENVARLKLGLNRSQVRFLLGTPLVVDPFRTDRWDYVYVYYKAGRLAEQKRITLFFDGDTLARIDGDLPTAEPAPVAQVVQAAPKTEAPAAPPAVTTAPMPVATAPQPEPIPATASRPEAVAPTVSPAAAVPPAAAPAVTTSPAVAATAAPAAVVAPQPGQAPTAASSVVPPLPSPKNAPAYVDPRPPAELSLQPETDVAKIQSDLIPPFPGTAPPAPASDATVLKAVNEWADAWARRDNEAYLAAYDAGFIPPGGVSRADWEKRKRQVLNAAKRIDLEIDSPVVERTGDVAATVTFNQFYRSDSYRDAVVKQLNMVERDGRWLIVEEKVLSVLPGVRP
ncbi:outer membrane protein assembly factor BamE domain-containing protein [Thiobacillus denitrificans]|uniref:outer membrane protein assembly factor BamE domain-containing protein n=1 Tax=Thiobacillus denitrificans TaxID=36861 RepID=UPI0003604F8D|nr:outer membrane protein assembly factor BamE [Thiobacillus denitrificans]